MLNYIIAQGQVRIIIYHFNSSTERKLSGTVIKELRLRVVLIYLALSRVSECDSHKSQIHLHLLGKNEDLLLTG